jgi:hypothetical protein
MHKNEKSTSTSIESQDAHKSFVNIKKGGGGDLF